MTEGDILAVIVGAAGAVLGSYLIATSRTVRVRRAVQRFRRMLDEW